MYSLGNFPLKEGGKVLPQFVPSPSLNWDPLMDPLLLPLRGKTCFLLWRLFSDCFLTREPETNLECPFLSPHHVVVWTMSDLYCLCNSHWKISGRYRDCASE